jgi:WD40 repeat protein
MNLRDMNGQHLAEAIMRVAITGMLFAFVLTAATISGTQPAQGLQWRDPGAALPAATTLPDAAKAVLGRFKRPLMPLAFSPDGKLLAFFQGGVPTTLDPCPVHLVDVTTGKVVRTLSGHHTYLSCAAFSPDGKTLATGGMDNVLRFWDVASGKQRGKGQVQSNHINSISWTPDGKQVVCASSELRVYDVATQNTVSGFQAPPLPNTEFFVGVLSPDGKTFISRSSYRIRIWDFASGTQLREIAMNDYGPHHPVITSDGKYLLDNEPPHGTQKWEIATGNRLSPLAKLEQGDSRPTYVYSPNGEWRAHQSGVNWNGNNPPPHIPTWYVTVGGEGKSSHWLAFQDEPAELVFSGNGKLLAWGGKNGSLSVWDVAQGKLVRTLFDTVQPILGLQFAEGGKKLFSFTFPNEVHEWDVAAGKELRRATVPLPQRTPFRTLAAGKILEVNRSHLGLWDFTTGHRLASFADEFVPAQGLHWPALAIGFSAGGRYVAGLTARNPATGEPVLAVWDASNGKLMRAFRVPAGGHCAAVSDDGRMAACNVADDDPEVRVIAVWEMASGKLRRQVRVPVPDKQSRFFLESIHLSADGRYLAAVELFDEATAKSRDKLYPGSGPTNDVIHVWDTLTGKLVRTLPAYGAALAFAPDSTRLAYAYMNGIVVLELKSGRLSGSRDGHWESARCVAWREDSAVVASAGEDGAILLWDVAALTTWQ